jgi:hypothetical protein
MRIDDLVKELESLRISLGDDTEVFYEMDPYIDVKIEEARWLWKTRSLGGQSYNEKVIILR